MTLTIDTASFTTDSSATRRNTELTLRKHDSGIYSLDEVTIGSCYVCLSDAYFLPIEKNRPNFSSADQQEISKIDLTVESEQLSQTTSDALKPITDGTRGFYHSERWRILAILSAIASSDTPLSKTDIAKCSGHGTGLSVENLAEINYVSYTNKYDRKYSLTQQGEDCLKYMAQEMSKPVTKSDLSQLMGSKFGVEILEIICKDKQENKSTFLTKLRSIFPNDVSRSIDVTIAKTLRKLGLIEIEGISIKNRILSPSLRGIDALKQLDVIGYVNDNKNKN
jgi:hypothetical protein